VNQIDSTITIRHQRSKIRDRSAASSARACVSVCGGGLRRDRRRRVCKREQRTIDSAPKKQRVRTLINKRATTMTQDDDDDQDDEGYQGLAPERRCIAPLAHATCISVSIEMFRSRVHSVACCVRYISFDSVRRGDWSAISSSFARRTTTLPRVNSASSISIRRPRVGVCATASSIDSAAITNSVPRCVGECVANQ
jgi:hypothetical protein